MLPTHPTKPDSWSSLGLLASGDHHSSPRLLTGDPFGLQGAVVDGKYLVGRAVAEGGFGVVYRGHHTSLDVTVAIKLLKLEPCHGGTTAAGMIAGFLQEAHSVARLRHANIVSVLDAGEHSSAVAGRAVPYIVFEWLDGPTLAVDLQARRGQGGRTLREAMVLWRPVCEAIAFAHQAGIVHRDLKPKNIIIQGTAQRPLPKVLDFGIAKSLEMVLPPPDSTRTDSARHAFSPDHAAPEQLAGTRTGPWTDVHALGLLLVELLVDQAPYGDADPAERYARAFSTDRPTPKRFGIDLGPVEPVLARALCLKPRERYANATDLLIAMDDAAARYDRGAGGRADPDRATRGLGRTSRAGVSSTDSDSDPTLTSTALDTTVLIGAASASSRSPRPRSRVLTWAGVGAAVAAALFAGWRLTVVRAHVDASAIAGRQDASGFDPSSDRSSSAEPATGKATARERAPLSPAPAASELALAREGKSMSTASSLPVKTPSPAARAFGPTRPVSSVEPGSTRAQAEQSELSTPPSAASAPSPVVTTPGVPVPYRLE